MYYRVNLWIRGKQHPKYGERDPSTKSRSFEQFHSPHPGLTTVDSIGFSPGFKGRSETKSKVTLIMVQEGVKVKVLEK